MNSAELRILKKLADGPCPIRTMERTMGHSFSWIFRSLEHLKEIGLIQLNKNGRASVAAMSSSMLGSRLLAYLRDSNFPDPELVFDGHGLHILAYIFPEGVTAQELTRTTSLAQRTIGSYLTDWRRKGIVVRVGHLYRINPRHIYLIEFIKAFSEHLNMTIADGVGVPNAILWQGRGEFLVSVDKPYDRPHFLKAADTALDDYGLDLVHGSEYYLYSPWRKKVTKAEALVQAILIDRTEHRMIRFLRKVASSDKTLRNDILESSKRYGIESVVKELLEDGGA
jgi:hypothetical protein